jgi:hypothetical protein
MVAPGGACAPCGGVGEVNELSTLELLEQPASSAPAVVSSPAMARRREGWAADA